MTFGGVEEDCHRCIRLAHEYCQLDITSEVCAARDKVTEKLLERITSYTGRIKVLIDLKLDNLVDEKPIKVLRNFRDIAYDCLKVCEKCDFSRPSVSYFLGKKKIMEEPK